MDGQRSADEAGSARASAVLFGGADGGFFEFGMLGEAEVIVGSEINECAAVDVDFDGIWGVELAEGTLEALLFAEDALVGKDLGEQVWHRISARRCGEFGSVPRLY